MSSKGNMESDDVSIDTSSVGSEVGVASSAVSAVTSTVDEEGIAGVGIVRLVVEGVCFFDFLGVGCLGHECESCPTVLH